MQITIIAYSLFPHFFSCSCCFFFQRSFQGTREEKKIKSRKEEEKNNVTQVNTTTEKKARGERTSNWGEETQTTPIYTQIKEMDSQPVDVDNIIDRLLEVRGSKPGQQVDLEENEIRYLCSKARSIFIKQPILLELEAPIKVC